MKQNTGYGTSAFTRTEHLRLWMFENKALSNVATKCRGKLH